MGGGLGALSHGLFLFFFSALFCFGVREEGSALGEVPR